MKSDDLISIIIPVYKVEKYLKKCVESVLNQTYKNLEIILVDDGSPDNCPQICDEYAKKHSNIIVIHKENGGLSDARNAGIERARGKYIAFLDSDDSINSRFVETLYNNLIRTGSDLSICGFRRVTCDDLIDHGENIPHHEVQIFEGQDDKYQTIFKLGVVGVVAWNKLYKAEIFKKTNVRYPKGKIHEDEFIIHEVLDKCNKVCFEDVALLYYLVDRKDSIMNQKLSPKRLHLLEALEGRVAYFQEKGSKWFTNALQHCLYSIMNYYFKFQKEYRGQVLAQYKRIRKQYKSNYKQLSRKMRLFLLVFDVCKPIVKLYFKRIQD